MEPIKVKLTSYEVAMAEFIGTRRHNEAIAQGRRDTAGFKGDGLEIHKQGASGETAFAKSMNFYYSGSVNTYKTGGDVGRIQVRTRSKHDYDLLIRSNDKDDDIFVLVTGLSPNFLVHGYILGVDAKRQEYLQDHGNRPPAYFVPQYKLLPIRDLYKKIVLEHLQLLTV